MNDSANRHLYFAHYHFEKIFSLQATNKRLTVLKILLGVQACSAEIVIGKISKDQHSPIKVIGQTKP